MSDRFTFHLFNADGGPVSLEIAELPGKPEAIRRADTLLADHASAARVVVCVDDVEILARHRPTADLART